MTNQFNNLSNEQLADEIGLWHVNVKAQNERLDALKDEAKRRGFSVARGAEFVVTVSDTATERLDTKRLKEDLGDALQGYYNTTNSKRVNVNPAPRLTAVLEAA